jgi:DNA-directed RNA polymerase subunit H (RpoH/RPB5)
MSSQNSSLINSIYKSRGTVLNLMSRQGYDVSAYEQFSIGELNLLNQKNELDMILHKPNPRAGDNSDPKLKQPDTLKMYIRYFINSSLPTTSLAEMVDDIFNNEEQLTSADTLFIISKNPITKSNMTYLIQLWDQYQYFVVVQGISGLQFNILNNTIVPPHQILSGEEASEALAKYNTTTTKDLPEISRFDPVAQIIGLRPDNICKIIRSSKSSITSIYYRACTNTSIKTSS